MIPISSASKYILLLGTAVLIISLQQRVTASSGSGFDCDSIVGCYADGYELGKEAGAEDVREGREHDSKCPPNDSLSFCTGYKAGGLRGWLDCAEEIARLRIEDRGEGIDRDCIIQN